MRKPVLKSVWLLLSVLILEGCGPRQGKHGELSYETGDAEVTITDCDSAAEGELVIPKEIEGLPVTSIGDDAFFGCSSLNSITVPDGAISIGSGAFNSCTSLTSITIPNGVTSIGYGAFGDCRNLTSITIPNGVTSIDNEAFAGCSSLASIRIPEGVTSIGDMAFAECSRLSSITIPDSITSIGGGVFFECSSLTSITIPDSVISIGIDAFFECSSLTSITIPQAFHSETQAFRLGLDKLWPDGFSLPASSSNSPENLTQQVLFYDFGDTEAMLTHCDEVAEGEVVIPDEIEPLLGGLSVTSIGFGAFHNCTNLTSITIPQAFHSEAEASRLALQKLWPNDFSLPASTSN